MNLRFDYAGHHVVVTGGAQGIGLQICHDFLQAGADVHIWDYSQDALDHARRESSRWANKITYSKVDVANWDSCQGAAKSLKSAPTVLINNAGITRDKSVAKMSTAEFDAVIDTNLNGAFYVTKSLLDRFESARQHKRIINMASIVGLYGNFGQVNYAAAKAGLIGITKTLARELGRKGFTVNAIAPGFIRTKMTEAMPAEVLAQMAQRVPVGQLGRTCDIASACLFLASEEACYINGTVLNVDGGLVI